MGVRVVFVGLRVVFAVSVLYCSAIKKICVVFVGPRVLFEGLDVVFVCLRVVFVAGLNPEP